MFGEEKLVGRLRMAHFALRHVRSCRLQHDFPEVVFYGKDGSMSIHEEYCLGYLEVIFKQGQLRHHCEESSCTNGFEARVDRQASYCRYQSGCRRGASLPRPLPLSRNRHETVWIVCVCVCVSACMCLCVLFVCVCVRVFL